MHCGPHTAKTKSVMDGKPTPKLHRIYLAFEMEVKDLRLQRSVVGNDEDSGRAESQRRVCIDGDEGRVHG